MFKTNSISVSDDLNDIRTKEIELAKVKEFLENIKQQKTLIILNDYNEITNIVKKKEDTDRIINEALQYTNVLMTSRPNAVSRNVECRFDRQIESIEFKKNIYEYTDRYFDNISSKLEDNREKQTAQYLKEHLKRYIRNKESIKSACRVPVNLELVCILWYEKYSSLEQIGKLDETELTDLYYEMTSLLLKRYIKIRKKQRIT